MTRRSATDNPIIVTGMHRSGTTMLARLLAAAGVFMGRELTANFESRFFQWLNRDILDPFGCSWARLDEYPDTAVLVEQCRTLKKIVGDRLDAGLIGEHFDPSAPPSGVWGWKDPRSCLTLPFFLDVFPRGRVVFIYRDPRDVAMSLLTRFERLREKGYRLPAPEARRRFIHYLALWDEYNRRAIEGMRLFPVSTLVRYETFVADPSRHMHDILNVLSLSSTPQLEAALPEITVDRAGAFDRAGDERIGDIVVDSELFEAWYGAGSTTQAGVAAAPALGVLLP